MLIFIRGTDKGHAVLTALILVLALSLIFMSLVPRIMSHKRLAKEYKTKVIYDLEQTNREILINYDIN